MRIEARIDRLRALQAGEAEAEPYIWPVFFKVDGLLFGQVLRDRLAQGTLTQADLEARGVSLATLPDPDLAAADSFHLPGGEHGNLPPMATGDEVDVALEWQTTLREGQGILRAGHSVVGIAAILFEEDLTPGNNAVKKAYTDFARVFQGRVLAAVGRAISGALPLPGPYSFSYRKTRESGDTPARFDPIELERELTRKMPHVHQGVLLDRDDFIGAMVWCVSSAELTKPVTSFTKLWTPTTGSEEGSWQLDVSVRVLG